MQALDVTGDNRASITSTAVMPSKGHVVCGFLSGVVKLFDIRGTARMLQSTEFSTLPVVHLAFSPSGAYISVTHSTGLVILLETATFSVLLQLEDHHLNTIPHYLATEFIEDDAYGVSVITTITVHQPHTLRMQETHIKGRDIRMMSCRDIRLEGNITGFKIHVSGQYIISSTDSGLIQLHRVDSEQLVGLIEVDPSCRGIFQDPAGLYVATMVGTEGNYQKLELYEVGTGKPAGELEKLYNSPNPNAISFSPDGRLLLVGGAAGQVSIWRVPEALGSNISRMLDILSQRPNYWQNFALTLPIIRRRIDQTQHMDFSVPRKLEEPAHFTPLTSGPVNVVAEKPVTLTKQMHPMSESVTSFIADPNLTGFSRAVEQPLPGQDLSSDSQFRTTAELIRMKNFNEAKARQPLGIVKTTKTSREAYISPSKAGYPMDVVIDEPIKLGNTIYDNRSMYSTN